MHTDKHDKKIVYTHPSQPVGKSDQKNRDDELKKLQNQCEEYLNGWKRALADYENYKRDSAKRLLESEQYQLISIANDMLPMIDMLEETMRHIPDDQKKNKWYHGLECAIKQWHQFTSQHGIQRIESLGREFNPLVHEAIQTENDKNKKDHEITSVMQHGYALGDTIIRPSKVTVNKIINS